MKSTTVLRNLSLYQFTHKRVEAIATELRKAALLPQGGRRYGTELTCEQAALFALAVAGAERVSDAADVATKLAALVNSRGDATLLRFVADAICEPTMAREVRHARVIFESSMAEVTMRTGQVERFFPAHEWAKSAFVPDAQGQGFVGRIGHIGGAVLEQLAIDHTFNDAHIEDEGEWIA